MRCGHSTGAFVFDYASVLHSANHYFCSRVFIATRLARARKSIQSTREIAANHPRLDCWARGRHETVAKSLLWGPYLVGRLRRGGGREERREPQGVHGRGAGRRVVFPSCL